MSTIAQEITNLTNDLTSIRTALASKGVAGASSHGFKDFASDIAAIPSGGGGTPAGENRGFHTDENGIWHKPEEWDDIESLVLPTDHDEVYILYDLTKTDIPYISLTIASHQGTAGSYKFTVDLGHISNGVFTKHTLSPTYSKTSSSAQAYRFVPRDNGITDDTIVVKVSALGGLKYVSTSSWATSGIVGTNTSITATPDLHHQPAVMRYGRMMYGTKIEFRCLYFESDNIIDFASKLSNTALTITAGYGNNYSMQRWRNTGWNITGNYSTSIGSLFNLCYILSDMPLDENGYINFDGWVKLNTTNASSVFYSCRCIRNPISVKNWDLTNTTVINSLFYQCQSLPEIIGMETWRGGTKITNIGAFASTCRRLTTPLDFSGLTLSALTGFTNTFQDCALIPSIKFSTISLAKVSSMTYAFAGTSSLKKIDWGNFTPPSSTCTNMTYCFYMTGLNELVLDGWNFSNVAPNNMTYFANNANGLKKLVFKNCTNFKAGAGSSANLFAANLVLEYLDCSNFDLSVDTGSYIGVNAFLNLCSLVEFYPPKNISKNFVVGHTTANNIAQAQNLSHDSLMRIINNLSTVSSATLTVGPANLQKLTDAEKAIATGKGWTLA